MPFCHWSPFSNALMRLLHVIALGMTCTAVIDVKRDSAMSQWPLGSSELSALL